MTETNEHGLRTRRALAREHGVGKAPTADAWTGCYKGSWQQLIVPEAFAHP